MSEADLTQAKLVLTERYGANGCEEKIVEYLRDIVLYDSIRDATSVFQVLQILRSHPDHAVAFVKGLKRILDFVRPFLMGLL
jgi:hypothetical protein